MTCKWKCKQYMQMKTIKKRYNFIPVRLVDVNKGMQSVIVGMSGKRNPHLWLKKKKTTWKPNKRLNIDLSYALAILHFTINPKGPKIQI